ncbi:type II toxin-antitoxin system VapC family toxin [Sorangium sp. So ce1078]|uniref:type II toxin-antitoxin system VapC family toxin n=1 Tax=Sorangium sp. So ce1078 TaxID=3133329 RepID=UPI003F5E2C32
MKVAFDTSVLAATLVASHRDHPRAIVWLSAVSEGALDGVVSVHALSELWSVLTKLPVSPPISPFVAREAISELLDRFEAVSLTVQILMKAVERCASKGLRSGAIFDAIHLATAESVGAAALLTFNDRDFTRLSVASAPQIVAAPDPPAIAF